MENFLDPSEEGEGLYVLEDYMAHSLLLRVSQETTRLSFAVWAASLRSPLWL